MRFLFDHDIPDELGYFLLIRRRSRVAERAALLRLLQRAGPEGLVGNINFA